MIRMLMAMLVLVAAAGCASASSTPPALLEAQFPQEPLIAPEALQEEFDRWLAATAALHPALETRADFQGLEWEATVVRAQLDRPLARREAFLHFARINPYFRDGHTGVLYPDYRGAMTRHMEAGGKILPIEVRFGGEGELRVFAAPPEGPPVGALLKSINGVSAEEMTREMLARAPGDTLLFQRAFVARRFASFFWLLYGDTGDYDIAFLNRQGRKETSRLVGAAALPVSLQASPNPAELFDWRILEGGVACFRAASFAGDQREALAAAAKDAFTAFKEAGAKALIIDIRENGGGDDPLWQESLMEYITAKPYAQVSRYAVRVTERNADPGDVIGEIRRREYDKRFTPSAENPLRFDGPVYILTGPFTYSAAIQFAVAAQDFEIAAIAGEETGGLSCQTGQTTGVPMPKTALNAFAPAIAFVRPSGKGCGRGVLPDVPVEIDEIFPGRTLEALRRAVAAG